MEDWGQLLKEAERALLCGRPGEALQYCDRAAVGGEEARYSASLLRGNILLEMGDAQGALSSFEAVADPDASDPEIDCARGVALFELARFPEAEAALKSSIRQAPHLAQSYYTLGLIAEFSGKGEEARWFRQARDLAPEKFGHHKQLRNDDFQSMLEDALSGLPPALAEALEHIPIVVSELPLVNDLHQLEPPISPLALAMLGGATGVGEDGDERLEPVLFLFKRNIERAFTDRQDMMKATRHAVIEYFAEALGISLEP